MSTTRDDQYEPSCINKPLQTKQTTDMIPGYFTESSSSLILKLWSWRVGAHVGQFQVFTVVTSAGSFLKKNCFKLQLSLKPTDLLRLFHFTSLVDEEYPCSRKSGISGICQLSDSGVVNEASDKQHEAWTAKKTLTATWWPQPVNLTPPPPNSPSARKTHHNQYWPSK